MKGISGRQRFCPGATLQSTVLVPPVLASAPTTLQDSRRSKLLETLNILFGTRKNSNPYSWLGGHFSLVTSDVAFGTERQVEGCREFNRDREEDFRWDTQPIPVPLIATHTLTLCATKKPCQTLRAIFQTTQHLARYPSRTIYSPTSWYDSLLCKRFGQPIPARHLTSYI